MNNLLRILLVTLFSVSTVICQELKNPCLDENYIDLKNKKIAEMSDREYEYFLYLTKECQDYKAETGYGMDLKKDVDIDNSDLSEQNKTDPIIYDEAEQTSGHKEVDAQNINSNLLTKKKSKFYIRIVGGYGRSFESVYTGIKELNPDSSDVFIYPGGGYLGEGIIGYSFISNIFIELNFGLINDYRQFTTGHILFSQYPVRISIVYRPKLRNDLHPLIGLSAGQYLTPLFRTQIDDINRELKYNSTQVANIVLGLTYQRQNSPIFYSLEGRYLIGKNYDLNSALLDGEEILVNKKLSTININSAFICLGIGYEF